MALEVIPFSLRNCLDTAINMLAARAHQKGLELACHIPENVPDSLMGDPARLVQVVVNLIGNAIKFTEQGEVFVSAEVQSRSAAGL